MKYRLAEIKTEIDVPISELPRIAAKKIGISESDISEWKQLRKSIDSRKKPHILFVYTIEFSSDRRISLKRNPDLRAVHDGTDAEEIRAPRHGRSPMRGRPVVVGAGPAGLFAALELAREGYRPLIIERGPAMDERIEAVRRFKERGVLDPDANMLFGEGGAGTFSDGKIGTGIKDGLIREVLSAFRDAGAGDEIMYLAKPHIGTDVLRTVIVNLRRKIETLGGEFRFNTKFEALELAGGEIRGIVIRENAHSEQCMTETIKTDTVVLAIGHSARDTFEMIRNAGADMEQKAFSIGVRIEHPQSLIDAAQYGEENLERVTDAINAEQEIGTLPPADYKLSYKASNGRGVYSFCMCPGGEVVVCSTKDGELCVNGMSERRRDSGTANSGILCDVRTEDFSAEGFDADDVLAGVRFQEKYERLAYENGGGDFTAPSCNMKVFTGIDAEDTECARAVCDSLPDFAVDAIREAIPIFAKRIKGYDHPDAVVTAVETRSSSPVRILRYEEGESNIKGLYPCGEGAGYAGGITSAACDGIRAARHVIGKFASIDKDCGNADAK